MRATDGPLARLSHPFFEQLSRLDSCIFTVADCSAQQGAHGFAFPTIERPAHLGVAADLRLEPQFGQNPHTAVIFEQKQAPPALPDKRPGCTVERNLRGCRLDSGLIFDRVLEFDTLSGTAITSRAGPCIGLTVVIHRWKLPTPQSDRNRRGFARPAAPANLHSPRPGGIRIGAKRGSIRTHEGERTTETSQVSRQVYIKFSHFKDYEIVTMAR